LKCVDAETWKEMLDVVNCKVLSIVDSDHVDAYLLSESSMFVFSHKLILKTCGTTTLLWGLPHILDIAAAKAGFPRIKGSNVKEQFAETAATPYRIFYSRKNFLFPDRQKGPHRSWNDEVKYLDKMFLGGSAYMVGKMNGDHWYLYLTAPNIDLTPPKTPEDKPTETKHIAFPPKDGETDDETLEVLMTDLDPENAKQFYLDHASAVAEHRFKAQEGKSAARDRELAIKNMSLSVSTLSSEQPSETFSNSPGTNGTLTPADDVSIPEELTTEGHALGTVVSESCGLSDVYPVSRYPDARVDAYLFTPCGFSANGVIPAPDQAGTATHYFTVHVTPEPQCSYASFETNVPASQSGRETSEVIEHVVDIFKPGRFSVTLFEAKKVDEETDLSRLGDAIIEANFGQKVKRGKMENIKGYRRVERIVHEFDGYDLVFRYYERNDWVGNGKPVVGEVWV
jgi:S-adenosylmethionine decarboxylase